MLTPAAVEAILTDFRVWLTNVTREPTPAAPVANQTPGVDLFTLLGQFTALRHDVNLQTKAVRAAIEQNAEALKLLTTSNPEPTPEPDDLRPVVKAVIDINDAIALSLRQMEKLREAVEPLLAELSHVPPTSAAHTPGFLGRLFGAKSDLAASPRHDPKPAVDKLRQLTDAAIDGYSLSLRRVERLLPVLELDRVPAEGEEFDPDLMEVVEVIADSGEPTGTVIEEVRPGYHWRGKMFRFAQVKVAK